jgi:hypothetical protein
MADFPVNLSNIVDDSVPGAHDGTPISAKHLNNLEAKVGVDGSVVTASLDYLLKNPASVEPGHKHYQLWASDGSAAVIAVGSEAIQMNTPFAVILGGAQGTGIIEDNYGLAYMTSVFQVDGFDYYGLLYLGTGDTSYGFYQQCGKTRSTDGNTPAAVVNNDVLGIYQFYGDDGAYLSLAAAIGVLVDGVVDHGSVPGKIIFSTNPVGSSGLITRMIIDNAGLVCIGTNNPIISDGIGLHIAGKILRIDTQKTPATSGASGNKGEICWDANYIYVAVNTNTWKRAALSTW